MIEVSSEKNKSILNKRREKLTFIGPLKVNLLANTSLAWIEVVFRLIIASEKKMIGY